MNEHRKGERRVRMDEKKSPELSSARGGRDTVTAEMRKRHVKAGEK